MRFNVRFQTRRSLLRVDLAHRAFDLTSFYQREFANQSTYTDARVCATKKAVIFTDFCTVLTV